MDSANQQHEPSELVALTVKQVLDDGNTDTRINRRTAVHLDAWINKLDTKNIEPQQA